jgi:hypothetical protein
MGNFTYFIRERVQLNGIERGGSYEATINEIKSVDNRVMSIYTGSLTEIVNLNSYISSSVKYVRVTNTSTGSVNLQLSGSSAQLNLRLDANGSLVFSSEYISSTFDNFVYGNLQSIKGSPIDTESVITYFIVTT